MAGFDEQIVREYFEMHGFFVRQLRKYQVQARKKVGDEEIDLLVFNPTAKPERKPGFFLFSNELKNVRRAVVVVKGWHTTQHFTPQMLRSSEDIFSFLEKNVLEGAENYFRQPEEETGGGSDLLKILVLPGLPVSEPRRSESMKLLQDRGVDGIISFRSMLADLLQQVETRHNYQKSDLLQILRILKIYDLVKPPQMELFDKGDKRP